jgi:antitoxin MazE
MKVKVAKWGNSLGVRLPRAAADMIGASAGSELDLTVENGELRLRGVRRTQADRLQDLLDRIDENAIPALVEWGASVGSEIIDDDYSRGIIVPGPNGAPVTSGITPSPTRPGGKANVRARRR